MNFATYTAQGQQFYGVDTGTGMIALSPYFPNWPTLRDVIAADALHQLALKAQDLARNWITRARLPSSSARVAGASPKPTHTITSRL